MKTTFAASFGLAILLCGLPAAADVATVATNAAFTSPTTPDQIVGDDRLATQRGKFVPDGNDAGQLAGSIVYFGLDMTTTWTTGGPNPTAYRADMNVRLDLSDAQTPKIDIVDTSSQHGVAISLVNAPSASDHSAPSQPGTIAGVAGGNASGILQAIQIAGNGNAVTNGASLEISTVTPSLVVASANGSTTCSACSFDTSPAHLGVTIALPGGNSASQVLGANGIAQNAQVTSDANAVANALHLALGVRPGAATSFAPSLAAGLFAPLPTTGLR